MDSQTHYGMVQRILFRVHYENTPIQIYGIFYNQMKEKNQTKNTDIFHISAQNIDCGTR